MTLALTPNRAAARAQEGVLEELLEETPPRRRSTERCALGFLTAAFVFQPILRPAGPGNSSPVDVLTVGAILASIVWARTSHRKLRAPYSLGVAVMVIAGCASGIAGPLPSLGSLTVVIDILLLLWCTALVNLLDRPRALRTALTAWCRAGVGWALVVAIAHFAHLSALEGLTAADGNRVLFTFGDPNYAAAYWVTTILVLYATGVPRRRWVRWVGYALLLWALLLTESNGGALELAVGLTFIHVVKNYRRRGWIGAVATVLIVGLSIGAFLTILPLSAMRQDALNSGQPLLVNSIGRSGQSSSERGVLVKESIQLYERSDGIIGLGPATTKPLLTLWQYPYAKEAHDDYLAALVERGLLGVVGLLILIGSIASRASPVIRRGLSPPFAAAVPRPEGIVAAVVALGVAASYYQTLHFRFEWAIFAFIAILGKDARR